MYAFEQDVPIDAAVHARIVAELGDDPPQGLLAHIAIEREDGHLHYLDLWQTQADCDAFTRDRLHPAVGTALDSAGIHPDREPPRREVTVVDLWGTGFPRRAAV